MNGSAKRDGIGVNRIGVGREQIDQRIGGKARTIPENIEREVVEEEPPVFVDRHLPRRIDGPPRLGRRQDRAWQEAHGPIPRKVAPVMSRLTGAMTSISAMAPREKPSFRQMHRLVKPPIAPMGAKVEGPKVAP